MVAALTAGRAGDECDLPATRPPIRPPSSQGRPHPRAHCYRTALFVDRSGSIPASGLFCQYPRATSWRFVAYDAAAADYGAAATRRNPPRRRRERPGTSAGASTRSRSSWCPRVTPTASSLHRLRAVCAMSMATATGDTIQVEAPARICDGHGRRFDVPHPLRIGFEFGANCLAVAGKRHEFRC